MDWAKALESGKGNWSKVDTVWCGQMSAGLAKARRTLKVAERLRPCIVMELVELGCGPGVGASREVSSKQGLAEAYFDLDALLHP